jgi:hypothetical protein
MYALKTAVCRYVIGAVTAAMIAAASSPLVRLVEFAYPAAHSKAL